MVVNYLAVGASILAAAVFGAMAHKDASASKYYGTERLDGKTVIITGANSGIGKETALELAKRGARIFMACRNLQSCEAARQEITQATNNERIYCRECDLASMKSIKQFAQKIIKEEPSIHILINNAGIMGIPEQTKTQDGLESQFGVNFFGHFVLTNLLLGKLKSTGPARVIMVSCPQHLEGTINFDDLNGEEHYEPMVAYNQSKLACVIFARELAKKLKDYCVTVNSVSPGYSYTELHKHMIYRTNHLLYHFAHPAMLILFKTPTQGAQPVIHCALQPDLGKVTGKYFDNGQQVDPNPIALDDELGNRLWEICEKLMAPTAIQKKKILEGKKKKEAKAE